ncbi:MAG: MarR family transcriptional regulator [Burkholderiales bacterium]|nr:MarR family transcriptional regulator [Burkholderiales bacterium]
MDATAFAAAFGQIYRETYHRAVRRIGDGRQALSAETTALMLHLSQAGPMTLSELARHFGRALSTLSAKIAALEAEGLLARQRDEGDGRRALVWLSAAGRQALMQALQVLDTERLAVAAQALPPAERAQLLATLNTLIAALPPHHRETASP